MEMAKKMLVVENDVVSQSRELSCDCWKKKRARDMSWVICKSLFSDLDIKYDNYSHLPYTGNKAM